MTKNSVVQKGYVLDTETEYTEDIKDLVYLISCAINDTSPDIERISKANLDVIYQLASFHSVVSVVAFAIESVMDLPYEFDQAKKKSIRKLALFDIERGKIFHLFDQNRIWYLPLKGIVLKDYYPKYGMREMADNDILCDATCMNEIKRIMEGLGFKCKELDEDGNHDVYLKSFTTFEMHRSLFSKDDFAEFYDYFNNVKDRIIRCNNQTYEYRFKPEDLYIYILTHEYKHYTKGGTGIRSLLDIYLIIKRYGEQFDWEYISQELQSLSLNEFEKMNRVLSEKVFSETELNEEEIELFMYYISSGAQGTDEHSWKNRLKNNYISENGSKKAKRLYLCNRLFVNGIKLKNNYPFVYKHKILLPGLYIYRLCKAIISKPKKVLSELKTINNFEYKDKDI